MNFFINYALSVVIGWISNKSLSARQIDEIKTMIAELEFRTIDSVVKNEAVASIIKSFARDLSGTAVDAIIKLLLLKVRADA